MLNLQIFNPELITNSRIKQLVELSNNLPAFNQFPNLIETGDEIQMLSRRERYRPARYNPVSLEHTSEYLLVYYDGQLVEVSDLKNREVVFRNITANCYQQLKYQHDWTPFSQQISSRLSNK